MTNAGSGGENCLRRTSPPTIATCLNALKKIYPMSFCSVEFSLFSQNTRGDLEANGSMQIAPVVLKASSLILCSFLFSPFLFSLCFLNFASLLFALSLN